MSFQTAASPSHLKILALGTVIVFIWFLYVVTDVDRYQITDGALGSLAQNFGQNDLLPIEEAREFCLRRRWNPYPYRQARRKVYDLILINTELEWLEIRMGQMSSQVDYFVILEADKTFTDTSKPLHVVENWERFKKYHHKMIRHTLDMSDQTFKNTWARESFSRNAMYDQIIPQLTGEQEAFQGDVMLVSDVDEIPRPEVIKALRNCDFPPRITLHTKMYYYSFQWLKREDWAHPQATFYDGENTVRPDDLRNSKGAHVYNAGWHCSYCFSTVDEIVGKIKSFSHTEMDQERFTDRDKIVGRVRNGTDMFDREKEHFDRIELNTDVPEFLLKHRETYKYMLDRDPKNANFRDYETPNEEDWD